MMAAAAANMVAASTGAGQKMYQIKQTHVKKAKKKSVLRVGGDRRGPYSHSASPRSFLYRESL